MNLPTSESPGLPVRNGLRSEAGARQLVGFRLDGADYAIAITAIREIILMKPITRLPGVADSVEGLINLRGTVIPVINLRKRFSLAPRGFDDETRIIVVTVGDKTMGCIVDEVTQVIKVAADQIQPVPVAMTAVSRQFVAGLAKLEDHLVILLDIETLFRPEQTTPPTLPSPTESGA